MPSIEVLSVEKYYGTQKALDKVGFVIEEPQIVALLGPNGAGKSTLMKIMTTFLEPDAGEVRINDFSIRENPMEIRKQTGYLPEHNPLYLNMYVFEYLEFVAGFYKNVSAKRIKEVAGLTGLLPESHKKIGALSKGYRQRVGLAASILHDPSVLIMDEPTTGLDPVQVQEIRNLIKSLAQDKIIILSTHIMQEVERLAERVIMLKKGRLVFDKPTNELKNTGQVISVEFDQRIEPELFKSLSRIQTIKNIGGNLWEIHFDTKEDQRAVLFDFAVKNGLRIIKIDYLNSDLEKLF